MKKTINILEVFQKILGAKLSHLSDMVKGNWAYTGHFSLTNVSRWFVGGSLRSLERFYAKGQEWSLYSFELLLGLVVRHIHDLGSSWVLLVDETVDKKAGKHTHGVGYHYSSKEEGVIKSIALLNLSVCHQLSGLSLPLQQEQLLFSSEKRSAKPVSESNVPLERPILSEAAIPNGESVAAPKAGRPKGSKNKSQTGGQSDATCCPSVSNSKNSLLPKAKGRPKGSKNKVKAVSSELKSPPEVSKRLQKDAKGVQAVSNPSGKKKAGRPKGSKNKIKDPAIEEPIAYTFQVLARMLDSFVLLFLPQLRRFFPISYVVADGGFGNNTVAVMVLARGFHLISKLQYNAALYLPFEGEQSGSGRPTKYGLKIDVQNVPLQYRVETVVQKNGDTWEFFQISKVLHKSFEMPLNVVFILKYDKKGHFKGNVVLFSTDLKANFKKIMDYYQIRFHVEFNFRDARQFFGLSHFKNIKEQQVTNVIGNAFFMTTLSNILLFEIKQIHPTASLSIQDLKAFFRAEKYLTELLNMDEFKSSVFFNLKNLQNMPIIGAINTH
jgi:putative transposase